MTRKPRSAGREPRSPDARPEARSPLSLHESVFECTGSVVVCLDPDTRVLAANRAAERLLGFGREELAGKSYLAEFIPERSRSQAVESFARASAGSTCDGVEMPIRTRAGQERVLLWNLAPLGDAAHGAIVAIAHDITGRKWAESLQVGQNRVLEMIATGTELNAVLDHVAQTIEQQSPGMLCSILIFEPDTRCLRHGAAPNLPDAYSDAIDGVQVGPAVGSCGTAAFRCERVIVENIETDPLWADFAELALQHDLRACWSQPIFASSGDLLGTFAMYYRRPRGPAEFELELIERAANLAGIALEQHQTARERARLQMEMQEAQRLESLGVLAGGIAHDFNNLLVGILGNADLACEDAGDDVSLIEALDSIRSAGLRAANLCRQMLAYSGRGTFEIALVDLNAAIRDVLRLMKASVSQSTAVEYRLADELPAIEADPTQIQQVVMNLATNAMEALGDDTGSITIATGVVHCDEQYLASTSLDRPAPGRYVHFDVTDTGCGMDADTAQRIFEPFFTTKFAGHGLGLAAVHGIVRRHRGVLVVDSEPGRGTTFRVLLPASDRVAADVVAPRDRPSSGWQGSGTVLLVDDEEIVRDTARRMIKKLGFTLVTAADGYEAVEVFRALGDEIVCVVLDLTMPGMSGADTFQELRSIRDDVRVVFSSGYTEKDAIEPFTNEPRVSFVHKPYLFDELRDALRVAMGNGGQ